MNYEEWLKTPEASAKLKSFLSDPLWKAAMIAIEDLSPARQSAIMPNLPVGGGDYLIGRVQGWEIFKEALRQLCTEPVEVKSPQVTHGVNVAEYQKK